MVLLKPGHDLISIQCALVTLKWKSLISREKVTKSEESPGCFYDQHYVNDYVEEKKKLDLCSVSVLSLNMCGSVDHSDTQHGNP